MFDVPLSGPCPTVGQRHSLYATHADTRCRKSWTRVHFTPTVWKHILLPRRMRDPSVPPPRRARFRSPHRLSSMSMIRSCSSRPIGVADAPATTSSWSVHPVEKLCAGHSATDPALLWGREIERGQHRQAPSICGGFGAVGSSPALYEARGSSLSSLFEESAESESRGPFPTY